MSDLEVFISLPTTATDVCVPKLIGKTSSISVDVEEFRGIPYAKVPGRWQHSILLPMPSSNFDATKNGPKCPQPSGPNNSDTFQAHLNFPSDVSESEFDCTNLFVQRPSAGALKRIGKENGKLPVFVWIHGGGFGFGAATDPMWDPTRLVLQSITRAIPIIVVSLNYRLNVFGFLASTELMSDDSKGLNFGLQDQHQALKWISQNISNFGGDSSKITIAGQSAGAASVHAHVLNARTSTVNPLFRRAIMMSGSLECLGPESLEETEKNWDVLCNKFQVSGVGNERVKRMREIANSQELVNIGGELGWMAFDSVIDGISISAGTDESSHFKVSFDGEDENAIAETNETPIEVLIGETNSEGSVFVADTLTRLTSFTQISKTFHSAYPSSNSANEVLSIYNLTPTCSLSDLHVGIIQFVSDVMFGLGASRAVLFFNKTPTGHRAVEVKEYSVQYGNPFPGRNFNVAHHCVDLIYGFDAFHDFLVETDKKEAARVDGAYFAKHSNAELTFRMQSDWLDFITKENMSETGSEGRVRVYRHDRSAVEEGLDDKHWVEQRKRFEVLKKEWGCAKKALWSLGSD